MDEPNPLSSFEILFECDECNQTFSRNYALMIHKETHIKKESNENSKIETVNNNGQEELSDIPIKEINNIEQTQNMVHLKTDIKQNQEENNVASVSNYQTREEKHYFEPVRKKRGRKSKKKQECDGKYECENCHKVFLYKHQLNKHQRCPDESKYVCEYCRKNCKSYIALLEHKTIHTGKKAYTCSTCEASFRYNSQFNLHMREHSKKKSHQCSLCVRKFYSNLTLTYHMETHKKYLSHFKCNKRNINKIYKCDICYKTFDSEVLIVEHQLIHYNGKQFHCEYCKKIFQYKRELITHTHKKH